MKKTAIQLADGRELIYYDERDDAVRSLVDTRDLPPRVPAPNMRYDAALDEWVSMAAHRMDRTHLPPSDECPLCPSRPGRATEIPADEYDVVVFENRFPSFAQLAMPLPPPTATPEPPRTALEAGHLRPAALMEELAGDLAEAVTASAVGRCEVVCFTSDHDSSFAELPLSRVRTVVDAWADRTAEIGRLPGVEHVFPFENRGPEIGVTLHHPHGQIYGYPFVAPVWRRMLDSARRYRGRTGGNLFADLLAAERDAAVRVVARSRHWTAFVPVTARWPVEVHLYPNRPVADLPALTSSERDDFAEIYLDMLRRGDRLYGRPLPYIAAWYQAPVHVDRDLSYLHLRLYSIRRAPDKLKYLAGSESAMGAFINDLTPEDIAARLREVAD
jgi:UDPglucose--hexose-1-phosphate uridylyltransferase